MCNAPTSLDTAYPMEKRRTNRTETLKQPLKRVAFVSVRLVRESSVLYERRQVNCASDATELVAPLLENADREMFVALFLDTKHRPTAVNVVSIGNLDSSICHPRECFKAAILANASDVIFFHNHPSSDPAPSPEDIAVTKRLCEAGALLGIPVLDSIVIGGGEGSPFISLKAQGLM